MTDEEEVFRTLKRELEEERPDLASLVKRSPQEGTFSLEEVYKVSSGLKEALSDKVYLRGGGYLIIEQTAALCAIDVNTGDLASQTGKTQDKDQAVTAFNLSCVPVIARQIRLRNLSGVIMIDFVNMQKEENRRNVQNTLRKALERDRCRCHIYGYTHLQLLELSRERKGKTLQEQVR